jgi:hypothetical protein
LASAAFEVFAASLSWSRSNVPTFGISRFDYVFLQHGNSLDLFGRLSDAIAERPQAILRALCLRHFCGQDGWRWRYFC